MANTLPIVHKRTSVPGRLPEVANTANTRYIYPGELTINLADQKVHSSNGSAAFEVGSNLDILTVKTIVANGSSGQANQVLRTNGSNVYWDYFTGYTGSQGPIGYTGSMGIQGPSGSSPYITPPAASSYLSRLIYVEIYKYIGVKQIILPARITVRDFARDNLNRLRLRLSSYNNDDSYTQIISESALNLSNLNASGFTGIKNIDLYTTDTSLGVSAGTKIGVARIDFGSGETFGSYNVNNIQWSVAGLYTDLMITDAAFDNTVAGLINTNVAIKTSTRRTELFKTPPSASSPLNYIVGFWASGLDYNESYSVEAFLRDDFGTGGAPRFSFWLKRDSDNVRVLALSQSGEGLAGLKTFSIPGVNSSGASAILMVDFQEDEGDGEGPAFTSVTSGPFVNDLIMLNPAYLTSVSQTADLNTTLIYTNSVVRPFVTLPTSTSSVVARGALACTRVTIDPRYPLGDTNVMLWECAKEADDLFGGRFRAQLATYDSDTEELTLFAATNNNNVLIMAGVTGLVALPLRAQADNTLGIPAGTIVGEIEVNFGTGAAFGVYAGKISWADGALINSRIQSSTTVIDSLIETALQNYSPTPFVSTVSDEYMKTIVEDIAIDFGIPGRTYVLNYRSDTAGSLRRLQFFLYDPIRGANIAIWGRQENYDWSSEVPESVYLSGAALGSVRNDLDYTGTGCTIFIKPGSIEFDKGASSYTSTTAGGINPNRVWSTEETQNRILNGNGIRNKFITFGPGGNFASLKLAIESLFNKGVLSAALNNPNNIHRAWWPFSDICTPAHQWTLQAMPGHTEILPAVAPAGVPYARGLLCWMGMTIKLRSDTVIKGETLNSLGTYAFDYNLGGRIICEPGAYIWSDSSVAVHQDASNELSIPSEANENDLASGLLLFSITGLAEGGKYKSTQQAWSCGTSDGQRIIFKDCTFQVDWAGQNLATHTSPENMFSGYYEFDSVTMIGGNKTISLVTSNPVVARHGIRVKNSDITRVSAGASNSGYVRLGKQPGVTYDAGLEP